jgi:hypothetical protein
MILIRIIKKLNLILELISRYLLIQKYNLFNRFFQSIKLNSKIKTSIFSKEITTFNSSKIRSVQMKEEDLEKSAVIVTCYFTQKPDPQTGIIRNSADFAYIQPWYESLLKINVSGIILHDGLEQDFINRYQNEQIQFRFCELGNYSIFEERWLLYHVLLNQLPKLEKVFFTDSNDVYITKNPFQLIKNKNALYVGRDSAYRIKDSGWLKDECDKFDEESNYQLLKTYPYQWVYNAGVVGGSTSLLFFFTSEMSKLILKAESTYHKDMSLLNIVIHEHFYPTLSTRNWNRKLVDNSDDEIATHKNLVTGFPLNSGFKDLDLNSKAFFIHK